MRLSLWALGCAALSLTPAFSAENCQLQPIATLNMSTENPWRVIVHGTVGGQPVDWIVDTGAKQIALTKKAVEAAGFKMIAIGGSWLEVYGGHRINAYVIAKDFELGGMKVHKIKMPVLPDDLNFEKDGLLGAEFLSHFDDDFDFANHKLTLIAPHPCDGKAVYWTTDQSQISKIKFHFRAPRDPHIHITVNIDGHDQDTILDTGAPHSYTMPLEWAEEVYDIDKSKLKPVGDPERKRFTYPFERLKIGGITINHPYVVLQSREASHMNGMHENYGLLGMHILTKLHMLISYKTREIYVTPAETGNHKGA